VKKEIATKMDISLVDEVIWVGERIR